MDVLAHFLWTFAIYWQHPKRWIAGVIGVLPDFIAFTFVFFQHTFGRVEHFSQQSLDAMPQYVFNLYSITHSLIVFAIVAAILWFFAREWFWLTGGWLLHIVIDIPSHTTEFFPTPFLWPISSFVVDGISWLTWWFMLLNYGALIALYTWLIVKIPGPKTT